MATAFPTNVNKFSTTVTSAGYSPGAGTIPIVSDAGLPTLTGGAFVRFTVVRGTVGPTETVLMHFTATGHTSTTLTGVVAVDGMTDTALITGDTIQCRVSAETVNNVQAALNTAETNIASNTTAIATKGPGTVTSVAMTTPGVLFTTPPTGSPITTSGTLALSLITQTANTVLAGPTTGSAAAPTMRALVAADIPTHAHSGADITSGTVAVARGGTGQSAYTDGQLLIGNTATGLLSKAAITAGTNITVTNGNGTITIAASGGGGSAPFTSNTANPLLKDATDATKLAAFDVSLITTATTRTYILPNVAGTIALNGSTATPLSSPGTGTSSERFGAGSSTSSASSTTAVGNGANATASGATSVGYFAYATGVNATAIGNNPNASGLGALAIGNGVASSHQGAMVLGYAASSTATNQFLTGSTTIPCNEAIFNADTGAFTLTGRSQSSTSTLRNVGRVVTSWATSTDASRKGRVVVSACDSTGTDREGFRIESSGSAPMIAFFGGTAVVKQATPVTLADVIALLQAYGLAV